MWSLFPQSATAPPRTLCGYVRMRANGLKRVDWWAVKDSNLDLRITTLLYQLS